MMQKLLTLASIAVLAACAGAEPDVIEPDPDELEKEAIEDFIEVSELQPIDRIRIYGQLRHDAISEDYALVRDNRKTYLVEFAYRCHKIEGSRIQPDIRREIRSLRARFDTIRGCRISKIYPITDDMVGELEAITDPYGR